jgi:hypothetical protein
VRIGDAGRDGVMAARGAVRFANPTLSMSWGKDRIDMNVLIV